MRIVTLARSGSARWVSGADGSGVIPELLRRDVRVRALAGVATLDDAPEAARDVLTYREMMERTAELLGRRRPRIVRVPVLTPRLSSYWVATPVEAAPA